MFLLSMCCSPVQPPFIGFCSSLQPPLIGFCSAAQMVNSRSARIAARNGRRGPSSLFKQKFSIPYNTLKEKLTELQEIEEVIHGDICTLHGELLAAVTPYAMRNPPREWVHPVFPVIPPHISEAAGEKLGKLQGFVFYRAHKKIEVESLKSEDVPSLSNKMVKLRENLKYVKAELVDFEEFVRATPLPVVMKEELLFGLDGVNLLVSSAESLYDRCTDIMSGLDENWIDAAGEYHRAGLGIDGIISNPSDRELLGRFEDPSDIVEAFHKSNDGNGFDERFAKLFF